MSLFPGWGYFWNPQIPQKFATVGKTFLDMSKTLKHSCPNNFRDSLLAKCLGVLAKKYNFGHKKQTIAFWLDDKMF